MYSRMDRGGTILLLLAFIQGTCGQTVTLSVDPVVERGGNAVFTCTVTGGSSPYSFTWQDLSEDPPIPIFSNGGKSPNQKYTDFTLSENEGTSIMTIMNTRIEDEGRYSCTESFVTDAAGITVEVRYNVSLAVESTLENNIDMYEATCEALNGRPDLPITWMLGDGGSPCDGTPMETVLTPANPDLFSRRSVCTFQATSVNYREILKCSISGYQLSDLNGEETFNLSIHSAPMDGIIEVGFQPPDPNLRVSCDIVEGADQPNPRMRNYYIYSNGTLIYSSTTGGNFVDVPESEFDIYTQFYCEAGNYLGDTTSQNVTYTPERTTTPSPPAEPSTPDGPIPVSTTEGSRDQITETSPQSGDGGTGKPGTPISPSTTDGGDLPPTTPHQTTGLGPGAIAGIALGAVGLIAIAAGGGVYYAKNRDGSNPPPRKNQSAVGTSNGSEKDKIKPVEAPRDQGSIQHTTDNPGQAEYAMVDRKKPGGGDMPDTRGPGQKEPQGMLYADLDLSASAGHTEKKVPQNKDDVVVYSSILV